MICIYTTFSCYLEHPENVCLFFSEKTWNILPPFIFFLIPYIQMNADIFKIPMDQVATVTTGESKLALLRDTRRGLIPTVNVRVCTS